MQLRDFIEVKKEKSKGRKKKSKKSVFKGFKYSGDPKNVSSEEYFTNRKYLKTPKQREKERRAHKSSSKKKKRRDSKNSKKKFKHHTSHISEESSDQDHSNSRRLTSESIKEIDSKPKYNPIEQYTMRSPIRRESEDFIRKLSTDKKGLKRKWKKTTSSISKTHSRSPIKSFKGKIASKNDYFYRRWQF